MGLVDVHLKFIEKPSEVHREAIRPETAEMVARGNAERWLERVW